MQVTLKIKRFNPEKDKAPWWGEYKIDAEPMDRLLDALNYVKWHLDGTLSYRRSCAHGVCGSDAMQINGANTLACKVLLNNLGSTITIEPLRGYKVIKDLIVDMDAFLAMEAALRRSSLRLDAAKRYRHVQQGPTTQPGENE